MTTATYQDQDAEECAVGACLISRKAVEAIGGVLLPSDFGVPHLGAAFSAIMSLYRSGAAIDATTVADELRQSGTVWPEALADLTDWTVNVPSAANASGYAEIITRFGAKRALHGVGLELLEASKDPMRDPSDIADEVKARIAELDSPALVASPGDVDLYDFVGEPDDLQAPPVIPGILSEDDRAVIVAPEGVGKSELARQIVVGVAHGVHPFTFAAIPPVPTLLVDLENPRHLIRSRLGGLTATAQLQARGARAPAVLWHRPGGIDLRKRGDRVAFEDVLRRNRPRLVALGPVYKAYTRSGRESDEQVAAEVQAILDDLRTRFTFALILEHHAPQANGRARELRPFGSSLWLRWPEYGIKLSPDRKRKEVLVVGRWRGDRAEALWPDELHRGAVWPWDGWWKDGVPTDSETF